MKKIRTIGIDGGVDMEKSIAIDNKEYTIPAIFSYSEKNEKMPTVILCHGTGSQKNEVGNLFVELSRKLLNIGIASIVSRCLCKHIQISCSV